MCAVGGSLLGACAGFPKVPAAPASAETPQLPPAERTPVFSLAWEVLKVASRMVVAMAPVQYLRTETFEMDWASNPLVSTSYAAEQKYHA